MLDVLVVMNMSHSLCVSSAVEGEKKKLLAEIATAE